MSIDTVEAELNEKDEQIYRTLLERACWYRDGCDGLEDTVAYFASGDCARDAARDLETALAEIRMYRQVLDLQRRQSAERLERLK